jgi:hypothetical protein
MSDFLIQLAAGVMATLVGVWLGRRDGPGPTVDNAGGVVGGDVTVDQSRHVHRELNVEFHTTKVAPTSSPSPPEDDEILGKVVLIGGLGFIGMLALAFCYLVLRDPALVIFRVASTFLIVFSLALLGQSLVRRRADTALLIGLAVATSTAVVTLLDRAWLSDPDLYSDRLAYLFASDITPSYGSLLDYLTWEEVSFLASQGLGLLLTGILLLLTAWICIMLVRAVRSGASYRSGFFSWRKLTVGVVWGAVAVLSMLGCRGLLSTAAKSAESIGGGRAPAVHLQASAKLSPGDPAANLLCVGATTKDDQVPPGPVSLEHKVRREQGAPRWQEVGAPIKLSANGTTCRAVLFKAHRGPYRFSLRTAEANFHSAPVSLVRIASEDR